MSKEERSVSSRTATFALRTWLIRDNLPTLSWGNLDQYIGCKRQVVCTHLSRDEHAESSVWCEHSRFKVTKKATLVLRDCVFWSIVLDRKSPSWVSMFPSVRVSIPPAPTLRGFLSPIVACQGTLPVQLPLKAVISTGRHLCRMLE
jgi:hypothetical protein